MGKEAKLNMTNLKKLTEEELEGTQGGDVLVPGSLVVRAVCLSPGCGWKSYWCTTTLDAEGEAYKHAVATGHNDGYDSEAGTIEA